MVFKNLESPDALIRFEGVKYQFKDWLLITDDKNLISYLKTIPNLIIVKESKKDG